VFGPDRMMGALGFGGMMGMLGFGGTMGTLGFGGMVAMVRSKDKNQK